MSPVEVKLRGSGGSQAMAALRPNLGRSSLLEFIPKAAVRREQAGRLRELGLPDDAPHVNPNGGAIALGHPLGMSGTRIAMTALHQLEKTGGKGGLATCASGSAMALHWRLSGFDGRNDDECLGAREAGALDLDIPPTERQLEPVRLAISVASRCADLAAPIDGVTPDFRDEAANLGAARAARVLGFTAKLCIHPAQLGSVEQAMAPSPEDIELARRIVEADRTSKGPPLHWTAE